MAATIDRDSGVDQAPLDPAVLEAVVARLLELHDLPSRPTIKRHGEPSRPCRCDHPIELVEHWYGPRWVRCLLCGRDAR